MPWFRKRKKPFVLLTQEQLYSLTLPELKKYQKAHAKYAQERLREISEQSETKAKERREQDDAQAKASQEQMQQMQEETARKIREMFEQSSEMRAQRQKETLDLMRRSFNSPHNPDVPGSSQEKPSPSEDESIIEAEILSYEEISTPEKKED